MLSILQIANCEIDVQLLTLDVSDLPKVMVLRWEKKLDAVDFLSSKTKVNIDLY